jgi:hypothetical protein
MGDCSVRNPHAVRRTYQQVDRAKLFLLQSKSFANAPLDAVALDGGGGMSARNQRAEARRSCRAASKVKGVAANFAPLAGTQ